MRKLIIGAKSKTLCRNSKWKPENQNQKLKSWKLKAPSNYRQRADLIKKRNSSPTAARLTSFTVEPIRGRFRDQRSPFTFKICIHCIVNRVYELGLHMCRYTKNRVLLSIYRMAKKILLASESNERFTAFQALIYDWKPTDWSAKLSKVSIRNCFVAWNFPDILL